MLLDDPDPDVEPEVAAGAVLAVDVVVEVELAEDSLVEEEVPAAGEEAEPLSEDPESAFLGEADEYRSEYQPPPLRMKPAPLEICRWAVA